MMSVMSADLLRRAAAKIRESARAATPGPWRWEGVWDNDPDVTLWGPGDPDDRATPLVIAAHGMHTEGFVEVSEPDADHIALWSPDVAELVAGVIDLHADVWEVDGGEMEKLNPIRKLAESILGEGA